MFVEQSLDDFHAGMELNYFGVLNIIQVIVDDSNLIMQVVLMMVIVI